MRRYSKSMRTWELEARDGARTRGGLNWKNLATSLETTPALYGRLEVRPVAAAVKCEVISGDAAS